MDERDAVPPPPSQINKAHDGTFNGLMKFVEDKFPKGSESTKAKRNAGNVGVVLDAVQRGMDSMNIKARVEQPIQAMMERVSYAYNFAAFVFYVCISDISDYLAKPRAIAINTDKPGGLAQQAELIGTNDFREIGVAWVDTEVPVSHILDIRPNPAAETKSQIGVQVLKSVSEASNALDEIMCLLQDGDTAAALAVAASSKAKLSVVIQNHADSVGSGVRDSSNGDEIMGGRESGRGDGGGGGDAIKIPDSIPDFKLAGDLIRLVEEGPLGFSPLFEWESEEASASRILAWGPNEEKQLKKLKTYFAMYTITKLAVHWGTLQETSPVIAANLKGAASGAFISNSTQSEKATIYLQGRHIPSSIKLAFETPYKGGYAAAAKEAHGHVQSCTDALTCGR